MSRKVTMYVYYCDSCCRESKCGCELPVDEYGNVVSGPGGADWQCAKCGSPVENLFFVGTKEVEV